MIFANPSRIVAPGAVPHRRAHLWQRKTNVGAGIAFQGGSSRKSGDGLRRLASGKIGKLILPVLNITFRQRSLDGLAQLRFSLVAGVFPSDLPGSGYFGAVHDFLDFIGQPLKMRIIPSSVAGWVI